MQISLNLKKCIFCTPFGTLLGNVVCKEGVLVDPAKIATIVIRDTESARAPSY